MLYPQVDKKEWGEKYGVRPKEGICHVCGDFIIADIPFADGPLRGFISRDHGCGERALLSVFLHKDEK